MINEDTSYYNFPVNDFVKCLKRSNPPLTLLKWATLPVKESSLLSILELLPLLTSLTLHYGSNDANKLSAVTLQKIHHHSKAEVMYLPKLTDLDLVVHTFSFWWTSYNLGTTGQSRIVM